jgi:hypothetical protein
MLSRKTHVAQHIAQEVNASNHMKILLLDGNALMDGVIVVRQLSSW